VQISVIIFQIVVSKEEEYLPTKPWVRDRSGKLGAGKNSEEEKRGERETFVSGAGAGLLIPQRKCPTGRQKYDSTPAQHLQPLRSS